MSILEAVVLGVLQGLSEFLPISSTAHLTLAGRTMGLLDPADPGAWTAFLAVVQLGTLVAVVAYFRRDLFLMARALVRPGSDPGSARLAWLVVLGTLPIAVLGLLLRDVIEGPLTKDLRVLGAALVVFGLLLWAADRRGRRARGLSSLSWRDALLVGGAQAFSLVPGASRSGTTMAGGFLAGLDRESAARYSFLLSVPAIAGSGLFELPAALSSRSEVAPLVVATLAAAVAGYAAIWGLLRYLQRRGTGVFVAYRLALGGAVLALVASGVVAPR